jgi:hypothetical protein
MNKKIKRLRPKKQDEVLKKQNSAVPPALHKKVPLYAPLTVGSRSALFRQTLKGWCSCLQFIFGFSACDPNSLKEMARTTVPINALYTYILLLKVKNVKKKP